MRWTSALTLPIVVAVILLLLLSPAVEALQCRGVSAAAASAIVTLLPATLLAGGGVLALPSFIAWSSQLAAAVTRFGALLEPAARHATSEETTRRMLDGLRSLDVQTSAWVAREALPFALTATSVVMLTFFLLLAQRSLLAGVLRAQGSRRARVRVLAFLRDARDGIVGYLWVMTVMNVLLSIATAAVLWAMGFAQPGVWAVVIALLLFVPYLGPMAIALLLVAASPDLSGTAVAMLAPSAAFLGLHAIEANVVSPWAMGHRLRMGRPALLVSVIVGGWTWGGFGAVLAVPLLIAGKAGLRRLRGHAVAKALLAAEDADAPNLAATSAGVVPQQSATAQSWSADPDVSTHRG